MCPFGYMFSLNSFQEVKFAVVMSTPTFAKPIRDRECFRILVYHSTCTPYGCHRPCIRVHFALGGIRDPKNTGNYPKADSGVVRKYIARLDSVPRHNSLHRRSDTRDVSHQPCIRACRLDRRCPRNRVSPVLRRNHSRSKGWRRLIRQDKALFRCTGSHRKTDKQHFCRLHNKPVDPFHTWRPNSKERAEGWRTRRKMLGSKRPSTPLCRRIGKTGAHHRRNNREMSGHPSNWDPRNKAWTAHW